VRASLLEDVDEPRAYPTAVLRIDVAVFGRSVEAVINELMDGDPPVGVSQQFLDQRAIGLVASTLLPGEEAVVADRLRQALTRPRD
jgi:hypothetical protein